MFLPSPNLRRFIFEIRPEDKIMDDEVNRFRDGGCGCHLDDGKI